MNSNPATQATPATDADLAACEEALARTEAMSEGYPPLPPLRSVVPTAALRSLIATAHAYHQLREVAAQAIEAASIRRVYRGIEVRVIDWPPRSYDALCALLPTLPSQHPACDPTDAGSGDVAEEGQG